MILMLALAMMVKLLVPVGWMPVFDGHRIGLELCGGVVTPPPIAAHAMHGVHGKPADHRGHDKQRSEQPCPYAALSFAATDADGPGFEPLPVGPEASRAAVPIPGIGRGLAAPPPPSTGPPILA